MKKILVTGGCGFVGSNLVRLLLEKGYIVTVIDSLEKGRIEYLRGLDVSFIECNLLDERKLNESFANHDAVFHLAAYGSVIESIEDPVTNFKVNVQGTFNVLSACVKNNIKKVIFSSTGGALMGNATPPVNEQTVPKPISPYGASKMACEGYCSAFSEAYSLPTVVFRFANVYGPFSAHKQGVFNKYLLALENGDDLIVYGDSSRDFIYVEDLVAGLLLGLETDKLEMNETFHLSTNVGLAISSLAEQMAMIRGGSSKIVYRSGRVGEVVSNFAENKKAVEILGFSIETSLTDGLIKTIKWFDDNRIMWRE